MSTEQYAIAAILLVAVVLFVRGQPRYDVVALLALVVAAVLGLVAPAAAFAGFGHPAVITVAAVLVISRGLRNAGAIDLVAGWLAPLSARPLIYLAALTVVVAVASAFMNNVGALAILMPVALESAARQERSPALLLMPLSFGAILGGMSTMIGTPPNVIIASYRAEALGAPYGMFEFAPVGATLALFGVVFLVLLGWRLIPRERAGQTPPEQLFQIDDYMTEVRVPAESELIGKSIASLPQTEELNVVVTALIRGPERRPAPSRRSRLRDGDVLVLRGDPTELKGFLDATGLELVGDEQPVAEQLASDDVALLECVVGAGSRLVRRSAVSLRLRQRYGLNLLAIAREDRRMRARLDRVLFKPGDVLLLQGEAATIHDTLAELGCLPLMTRGLRLGQPRRVALAVALFAAGLAATAFGLMPAALALTIVAVAMVLTELVGPREIYDAVDWPVIVLLGAMIPVGSALESTGLAALVAAALVTVAGSLPLWAVLALVLIATMTLSDVMNNAATAVVMAPIALGIASALGASADAFLMAVAVGASCAFLTPIGHQCNTLVMGPGGYRFSDYWRLGLPLEIIIVAVGVPLILLVWG